MSFKAGAIVGDLILDRRGWTSGYQTVVRETGVLQNNMAQLKASVARAAQSFSQIGLEMAAVGAAVTAGFGLALKAASDAVEGQNLFDVSLGKNAKAVQEWSEQISAALGSNADKIRQHVATFNVMMGSMGIAEDAAVTMSKELTKLAEDIPSFYNIDTEAAFEKLRSGIMGEAEPLKQLGIALTENTVKQFAWANGIAKSGQELNEQQKIVARFGYIMENTKGAQGDLIRTQNSYANATRRLSSETKALQKEIGMALMEPVGKVVAAMNLGLRAAIDWAKANPELAATFTQLGAVAGVALTAFGSIALAAPSIVKAFNLIRTAALFTWAAITGPVAAVISALAAVGAAVYAMRAVWVQNTNGIRTAIKSIGSSIQNVFSSAWTYLEEWWSDFVDGAGIAADAVASVFSQLGNTIIQNLAGAGAFWKTLSETWSVDAATGASMDAASKDYMGALGEKISNAGRAAIGEIEQLGPILAAAGKAFTESVGESLDPTAVLEATKKQFKQDFADLKGMMPDFIKGAGAAFEGYADIDYKSLLDGVNGFGEAAAGAGGKAKKAAELTTEALDKMLEKYEETEAAFTGKFGLGDLGNTEADFMSRFGLDSKGSEKTEEKIATLSESFSQLGFQMNQIGDTMQSDVVKRIGATVNAFGSMSESIANAKKAFLAMKSAATQTAGSIISSVASMTAGVLGAIGAVIQLADAFGLLGNKGEEELHGMAKVIDEIKAASDQWVDEITDAFLEFTKTGTASWKELAQTILDDIYKIAMKELVVGPLMEAAGGILGLAKGGAYVNGNIVPMAHGGYVTNGPEIVAMASGALSLRGEAGNEAVLPLQRLSNGNLGVGGAASNTVVNVNDYRSSGERVEVTERMVNGQRQLDIAIRDSVSRMINGGTLDGAIARRYGMPARAY